MREITCKLCGKKFEYEGRGHALYCGDERKQEAEKARHRQTEKNRRDAKRKKRRKNENENDQAIIDIAVKAAERGMSYGQYVTRYL